MSSAKLRNACGTSVAALILHMLAAHASVEISAAPTSNMNCSAGVCSPTAKDAVLNVTDLAAMLSSTDTTVKTGAGAVTIGIVSSLAWASSHRLTLDASLNVNIKAQVMVEGTAGLTIVTNDGGTGGDLMFYPGGKIDFWDANSSLVINSNQYVLNDIQGLASAIAAKPTGYFSLARDYDAAPDGTYLGAPISRYFNGTFEGLGHAIANISIDAARSYSVGLFSEAGADCLLRDIRLTNILTRATHNGHRQEHNLVGALAGISSGSIINASVDGNVVVNASNYSVGGLVGISWGVIRKSHSTVDITSPMRSRVGGLVGDLAGGGEIITLGRRVVSRPVCTAPLVDLSVMPGAISPA